MNFMYPLPLEPMGRNNPRRHRTSATPAITKRRTGLGGFLTAGTGRTPGPLGAGAYACGPVDCSGAADCGGGAD
ncbi:MAG: hypothetical protein U0U69_09590 [Acidimicrobiia bacterium]